MGGWGPYTLRQIQDLFETYGFTESRSRDDIDDLGGVRRTEAEARQLCVDWDDPDQRSRYLRLVDDVLDEYPEQDGKPPPEAKRIQRALRMALPDDSTEGASEVTADFWQPVDAPRIFLSHHSSAANEVEDLSRMLEVFGFACFIAHDSIQPSRTWLPEVKKALRTCDFLVAYITQGFGDSPWTAQEVGWALGRGLVVVSVCPFGSAPQGFLAEYQAIRYEADMEAKQASRLVFSAIADAVLIGERPGARRGGPEGRPTGGPRSSSFDHADHGEGLGGHCRPDTEACVDR